MAKMNIGQIFVGEYAFQRLYERKIKTKMNYSIIIDSIIQQYTDQSELIQNLRQKVQELTDELSIVKQTAINYKEHIIKEEL